MVLKLFGRSHHRLSLTRTMTSLFVLDCVGLAGSGIIVVLVVINVVRCENMICFYCFFLSSFVFVLFGCAEWLGPIDLSLCVGFSTFFFFFGLLFFVAVGADDCLF